MDDALRVVVEMHESLWARLKNALEDLSAEEIHWRPLPQANSIRTCRKITFPMAVDVASLNTGDSEFFWQGCFATAP